MRNYIGIVADSRRWRQLPLRAGDVIVCTPPKSGTTWMQAMIALLISGDPAIAPDPSLKMPWVDQRFRDIGGVVSRASAQKGRRSFKTHTPLDGIPLADEAVYITVHRHPLDVHFSMRGHVANQVDPPLAWYFPEDEDLCYRRFLEGADEGADYDSACLAAILRNYRAALDASARPNVHRFHYAEMRRDPAAALDRLAAILGVDYPPAQMAELLAASSFENMRRNAGRFAPGGGRGTWKSDAGFFHSGSHRKWEGRLTEAQYAAYDAAMDAALSPDERRWLETGSL